MITEPIFIAVLFFTLVLLIATFYFQNPAFGGITIVALLSLMLIVVPNGTGISHDVGKNITTNINTTTNETFTLEQNNTTAESSWTLFLMFMLLVFYIGLEILNFRSDRKRSQENNNHEDDF